MAASGQFVLTTDTEPSLRHGVSCCTMVGVHLIDPDFANPK